MIIECPTCAKRYRLADDAVPPEGRTVRCAACKTAWHQEPPTPESAPAPVPEPAPTPPPVAVAPAPIPTAARMERPTPPPPRDLAPVAQEPMAPPPTAAPPPRSGWVGNVVLAVLALALLALLLLTAPGGVRGLDLGARLEPAMPGSALKLTLHEPIWGRVLDGRNVLTVAGKLDNPTRVALPVPPLAAELRDAEGAPLVKWTAAPPATQVEPGGSLTFDTAAIAVPPSATRIVVGFTPPTLRK